MMRNLFVSGVIIIAAALAVIGCAPRQTVTATETHSQPAASPVNTMPSNQPVAAPSTQPVVAPALPAPIPPVAQPESGSRHGQDQSRLD